MTRKLLPLGTSDFKELIDNHYYYVDKTLLIKDIFLSGKVLLLSRPRRFGKTLNLSMLNYFFEKSEVSTSYLFEELAIWQESSYRVMQGQFPVIFLTFKSAMFSRFDHTQEKIGAIISEEYNRHKYLLDSPLLEPQEKKYFERIRQGNASHVDISGSLGLLSKFLSRYHQKKVIVLIDEYDVPVQSGFLHGFYQEILELIQAMLTSVLKDNPYLEKGVLSGILTLAKAGIFSGLNNVRIYNVTDDSFADKFGFTGEETEQLLSYYGIQNHESIKEWYNGYIFGHSNGMFNPWSLLSCIESKGKQGIYWANTSDNLLLKRLLTRATSSTKSDFENLLSGKLIEKTLEESIVFPDLDKRENLIWSLLLFSGYLTYKDYDLIKGKKVAHDYVHIIV